MCYKVLSLKNAILSYSHPCNIIQNSLIALKVSICFNYSNFFYLGLRATTHLFITSKICLFKYHTNGIISYIAFSDWFFSFSNIHLRFIHVFAWLYSSFHFTADSIPLYGYTTVQLCIYLLKDILAASSVCEFCYKHACKFLYGPKFSYRLSKYLGMWLINHGKPMFTFVRNCKTIFQYPWPFSIPVSNEWAFLLLCILTRHLYSQIFVC